MTEPEEARPASDSHDADAAPGWVRVDRSYLSGETPAARRSASPEASDELPVEVFTPIPPIDPEQSPDADWAGDDPVGEPVLAAAPPKLSALARIRSTAHADKLTTIERLRDGQQALSDRWQSWLITLAITAIAFAVRFVNLAYPNKLEFDETYYAKDAWTLWQFGFETSWPKDVDARVAAGEVNLYTDSASFIVHPPMGKWLISLGEQIFGMNSFGWRFMPLVFGTLLVLMTIRMARRLSRSTLIGALAGLLLTVDGLAFVMSRLALLDVFQAFFLVAGVAAVVADRDYFRGKLATVLEARGIHDFGGRFGPLIWWRPWRVVAGVMFGLAIATKWNSLFVLGAMGLLSVIWDVGARRLAGADFRSLLALVVDGIPAFVKMVVVAALVYLISWSGWLFNPGGWDRDWGANHPEDPVVRTVGEGLASLWKYHLDMFDFHNGAFMRNEATHSYDAHPIGWLLMVRPTGIDAVNSIAPGVDGCTAAASETCMRVVSAMGTPLLWWLAFIALIVGFVWWIGGRDWRFGVPIVAAMSTYVFWFPNADRPVFFFYAICIIPFTVTLLAMAMGLVLGPRNGPHRRRGAIIVGVLTALVVLNFAYIYPLLTDQLLLTSDYYSRVWFRTWI